MTRAVRWAAAVLLLTGAACGRGAQPAADLVLRGGTVVDGTGAAPFRADVAVRGGRILDVGILPAAYGRREIDVSGRIVAPGFVDLHSHADLIVLAERDVQEALLGAKISQGVTSIVVGNCGLGVAPSNAAARPILAAVNSWMTPRDVAAGAWDVAEYLDRLQRNGLALNVGTLVPHGPLRISAMGLADGRPDAAQFERMREALLAGLEAGAFGLSTGLIYPPGMFSDTDELQALAGVVAERDRLLTVHVRGSSELLLQATGELVSIARATGGRVHHSHLEAVGRPYWPDVARALALEDVARREGLRISHDVFPYTRAATMMSAIFPPWSLEGGVPALLERLVDPVQRARMRHEIESRTAGWPPWEPGGWPHNLVGAVGWDGIRVASVGPDGPAEWVGRDLAHIAREQGREPFDVVADLMLSQRGQVGQLVDEISGRDDEIDTLLAILGHPAAAIVSDAEDYGRGTPHPAHAGAFLRALRLGRERLGLSLESLVHRMTGYPAGLIGLPDRGVIRAAAHADLVVFDPETARDRATWEQPRLRAVGLDWVLINGQVAVEAGGYVGGLHGAVLRPPR